MSMKQPVSPSTIVHLIRTLSLSVRLFFSPMVPMWTKLIPLAAFLYLIFPFDFIPDFIPGLGQMDDLTVILIAIWAFVQLCPKDVIQKMQENENAAGQPDAKVVDGSYRVMDDDPPQPGRTAEQISPPDHSRS